MAWATPTTRTTGTLVTAAIWNSDVVDNPIALRAGGIAIASQAALDFIYATSATQLARLAKGSGLQVIRINSGATAYEFANAAAGSDTQIQFNDGGSALGGDADLTYNKTTNTLGGVNETLSGTLQVTGVATLLTTAAVAGSTASTILPVFSSSGTVACSLADDATVTMTLTTGFIFVYEGNNGTNALFFIDNGTSRLHTQSSSTWAATNTDTKASIEASGSTVTLRNRLGLTIGFRIFAVKIT